ncbi:LysR family transcriptional regulator [Photobacterium rosenbergii]|uniref:LysR substrate-binding domain-containing protein n=1 Tax=Photobacterium rosenbergii TaxID=294936 RepID=A0ABU3ZI54_9GAMM|nr:LysR substrate-binding domain-containing protein [Photobacterium rosenbergii]MDV5169658.1 LysR substrate-binding domain-containing protein [Photobacterium rosenbergii]
MIKRLQYFNAVVETGSISETSRVFDVQPSSVSRQLAALEEELGVRLINRNTRTVSLTEAGQTFYSYSQHIVASLDEARRTINDLQDIPKGKLVVSSTVGYGEAVILPLINEFRQRYPEVEISLELSERVKDLIEDNIDVAIRSGELADSSLVARKLQDNDFILCASPEYLDTASVLLSPEALAEHQCIRYGYPGWQHWYLMGESLEKLTIGNGLEVNTVNGQKQLLLSHCGIALIPYWAVANELKDGRLQQLLPDYHFSPQATTTATYAIYLKREMVSPKVRVFIDYLLEQIHRGKQNV